MRQHPFGLRPLGVRGVGDCFFRAVSHQLYGNPGRHDFITAVLVEFFRQNPERLIESNFQPSWMHHLTSMLSLGNWADGITLQDVANVFNIKIHINESQPDFAEITIVEAVTTATLRQEEAFFFVGAGHVEEFHFVSTSPCSSTTLSIDDNSSLQVPDEETELREQVGKSKEKYIKELTKYICFIQ